MSWTPTGKRSASLSNSIPTTTTAGHIAFEQDRLRQEDLKLAGIEMTRVTGVRMDREPEAVVTRLRRLLAQRRRHLNRKAQ